MSEPLVGHGWVSLDDFKILEAPLAAEATGSYRITKICKVVGQMRSEKFREIKLVINWSGALPQGLRDGKIRDKFAQK